MRLFGPPDVEELEAKRDVNRLMRALGYKDSNVGFRAAKALGRLGAAPEPLVARLNDPNEILGGNAWRALVEIGAPAVPAVAAALSSGWPEVRRIAARILGQIGGPTAVEPLVAALRDQDYLVRDWATEALFGIGAPVVSVALRDQNDDVRTVASEAIAKCGAKRGAARTQRAAAEAKEIAERNKPKFYRTPCDLASHEWRPLGHWGHHDECKRCDARLELETGSVWAMVQGGSFIRIGQMERWYSGPNSMDGGWRPVTAPVPAPAPPRRQAEGAEGAHGASGMTDRLAELETRHHSATVA